MAAVSVVVTVILGVWPNATAVAVGAVAVLSGRSVVAAGLYDACASEETWMRSSVPTSPTICSLGSALLLLRRQQVRRVREVQ